MIPVFMGKAPKVMECEFSWEGEGWKLKLYRTCEAWTSDLQISNTLLSFKPLSKDASVDDFLKFMTFQLEDLADALADMGIEPCA